MDDTAVVPQADDLPGMSLDMSEVIENEAIDDAAQNEKEFAALNASKGWQKIAATMRGDIDGLRTGTAVNFKDGESLEEVGKKYMIAAAVAVRLQGYLDMVDNATKATVEYERRKRTDSKST